MIRTAFQLELKKWLPRPLLWGLWTLCFTIISVFFYRLCVDFLALSQKAFMQNGAYPSVLLDIVKPLSSWSVILLSLLLPILTTSAWSQENRHQTIVLWANSTMSASDMVWGKFLCILLFPLSITFVEISMLLTLSFETQMDSGWLISTALSIMLISASLTALGMFIASLFSTPLVAMTLTYVISFAWMLLEWLDPFPAFWGNLSSHLSLLNHSYRLFNGILLSTDLIYYFLFCGFWIILTQYNIRYRLRHIV